jgi:ATP-dependent DNA helicase RecQ
MMITSTECDAVNTSGSNSAAPDGNHHSQFKILNSKLILKQYWGYDDFRGIQREIIESICNGHDTLGLMPTGGGKSITFQVPALAMEGVCIVITPLIALMKDQVQNLRRRGIIADAIYAGMSHENTIRILENSILGRTKLLYVSPERLESDLFLTKMRHMKVSFITVDEAHCISQWGYDFRPSYLRIANIREVHPVPILALTATATPRVVDDICEKLQTHPLPSTFNVFRMSFERKNLTYVVRKTEDKLAEMIHILQRVGGSAIVYVRSRKRAKEISNYLNETLTPPPSTLDSPSSTFYHAGLDQATRDQRQKDWQHDKQRIIVATNAFGMGIDKPDVRLVIHYDSPDSIEAYFQEAGRAGRDGERAYAVLLCNGNDNRKLMRRVDDEFPPREYIKDVYEDLAYYLQVATGTGEGKQFEFSLDEFCMRFHHFPVRAHAALQLLSTAGYIDYMEEQDSAARVHFLTGRDDLYRLQGNTEEEDRVIVSILRLYGGLFADYGYIDESLVAREAGLTPAETYDVLKRLDQKYIISFIPRKRTPYVRYIQRREERDLIVIPHAIYEDRRALYQERIEAMLRYMNTDHQCRSRQLLRYFGETDSEDCGHCDVCHSK